MSLLDLDTPTEETPTEGVCRCCHHALRDPVSLAYGIGPDCRRKLGVTSPPRVRITGVQGWRDCEGQTDLLEVER